MSFTFSQAVELVRGLVHEIKEIKIVNGENADNTCITSVTSDSREVSDGALFCCIRGEKSDGHNFVAMAEANGAVALLCEHPVESRLPQIVILDSCNSNSGDTSKIRPFMGDLAAAAYDNPADKLLMVGVTGTNGKTTTTWIIRSILNAAGIRTGLLGTIIESDGITDKEASRTTPESYIVQRQLASMVKNGCGACVMETSSHGLYLGRLRGTRFDIPVFTNLNPDHLDFHKDMENYFQAKRLLFTQYLKKPIVNAAVNADDPFGQRLVDEFKQFKLRGFAMDKDNIKAFARVTDWKTTLNGTTMRVEMQGFPILELESPLVGAFNVWNVLCAVTALRGFDNGKIKITDDAIIRGVASIPQVPGRLERHVLPNGACCFIDFAHTPAALRSVLSTVRELTKGKLIASFGHGGGRYAMNRPELGKFAAEFADHVIVTMDNPRDEDPVAIAQGIESGIDAAKKHVPYECIIDRRKAIYHGLDMLAPDDVFIVTGKGPEPYLEIQGRKIPYSDAEAVQDWLKSHGNMAGTGTTGMTMGEMFALIGLELPEGQRNLPFPNHIATDSRSVRPNGGFIALEGAKVDGHAYVSQAIEHGASLVIVRKGKRPANLENLSGTCVCIELDDPESDLARMASLYLDKCLKNKDYALQEIVAVTGSVGKTTTRTAFERVLSRRFRVHAATGSLNTRIGCTATVLAMPVDTELLLLEFGANKPNEIAELAELFPPTLAVITQVAPVHLEGFLTIEGVLRGKMEITNSRNLRCFLYNADNELLCKAAEKLAPGIAHAIGIKAHRQGDFKIENVRFDFGLAECDTPSLAFKLSLSQESQEQKQAATEIRAAVWGEYISLPLALAAAAGNCLGMSLDDCAEALRGFQGLAGRGRILTLEKQRFIVDDAYNANPASMRASLETFVNLKLQDLVAVLGEMREMGEDAVKYHTELTPLIDKLDGAILVGNLWHDVPEAPGRIFVANWQEALDRVQDINWQGLLVKGSNSIGLQNIVKALEAR